MKETKAEIAHAGAIDDGSANDVAAFREGETSGHAVIGHHTAVARQDEGLLTVNHHMEAELEPTAKRTSSMFSSQLMTVTAQKSTP